MTQPGIDLGRSGWTNPDGFQRAPRSSEPAPVIEVCGTTGPEGWACDLKPGHLALDHWADTGEAPGLRWRETQIDTRTAIDPGPVLVPGPLEVVRPDSASRSAVSDLVRQGLESSNPGQWYAALVKIQELLHG
jgi:hypothetical protein